MMASVTPAAAAISLVVVPENPLREKKSRAVSTSWIRRSLACRRGVGVRGSVTVSIVSQYLLTVKGQDIFGGAIAYATRREGEAGGFVADGVKWFSLFRLGGRMGSFGKFVHRDSWMGAGPVIATWLQGSKAGAGHDASGPAKWLWEKRIRSH